MKSDALSYSAIAITVIVCTTVLIIRVFVPIVSPRPMPMMATGNDAQILDELQRINSRLDALETKGSGTTTPGTPSKSPAPTATNRTLFLDTRGRFSIVTPTTCQKLKATTINKSIDPLLPKSMIGVGVTSFPDWFSFYALSKVQYDAYQQAYKDTPGTFSKVWQLSDGTYLGHFAPQDGPVENGLETCTWEVRDGSGTRILAPLQ